MYILIDVTHIHLGSRRACCLPQQHVHIQDLMNKNIWSFLFGWQTTDMWYCGYCSYNKPTNLEHVLIVVCWGPLIRSLCLDLICILWYDKHSGDKNIMIYDKESILIDALAPLAKTDILSSVAINMDLSRKLIHWKHLEGVHLWQSGCFSGRLRWSTAGYRCRL